MITRFKQRQLQIHCSFTLCVNLFSYWLEYCFEMWLQLRFEHTIEFGFVVGDNDADDLHSKSDCTEWFLRWFKVALSTS